MFCNDHIDIRYWFLCISCLYEFVWIILYNYADITQAAASYLPNHTLISPVFSRSSINCLAAQCHGAIWCSQVSTLLLRNPILQTKTGRRAHDANYKSHGFHGLQAWLWTWLEHEHVSQKLIWAKTTSKQHLRNCAWAAGIGNLGTSSGRQMTYLRWMIYTLWPPNKHERHKHTSSCMSH